MSEHKAELPTDSTVQLSPLDILILAIRKAQGRGAFNLNEAALIAKAVEHFEERKMAQPVPRTRVQTPQESEKSAPDPPKTRESVPSPLSQVTLPKEKETQPKEDSSNSKKDQNSKILISEEDLTTEIRTIGANRKASPSNNIMMEIEDDDE